MPPAHEDSRADGFADGVNEMMTEAGLAMRLASRDGAGFGVLASRDIPAGTRVLVERPLALTVAHANQKHVCASCLSDARTASGVSSREIIEGWLRCCERCRTLHFCSEACERAAMSAQHSQCECDTLAALSRDGGLAAAGNAADLVLQAVRLLAMRAAGQRVQPLPGAALEVGFEAYVERLVGFARDGRTGEVIKRAASAALSAVPAEARVPAAELCAVLNRHQANVYGVMGRRAEGVGLASFVGVLHLLNHSCCPNVVFDSVPADLHAAAGAAFALVALRDIARGDELCHCYASSSDGPQARRRELLDHHGFECRCDRCAADPASEMRMASRLDALRCTRPECGTGLSYPLALPAAPPADADGGDSEDDGLVDGLVGRRCVQCGWQWDVSDCESDYSDY
jgi:hypothetical protein